MKGMLTIAWRDFKGTVTTPMFVETGDTIEINTETGEYVGRVS